MKLNIAIGRLGAVLIGVLLISLGGIARATLVEGFESGAFGAGESATGDAGIKGTYFGIAPAEGTKQLLLTTINNGHDPGYTNQNGTDAVANATLATFFGVSGPLIRDGTAVSQEGSGFKMDLGMLTAGTTITLGYDFLTDEIAPGQHNDFAFYTLTGNSGVTVISDTTSLLLHPTTDPTNPFALETGYQTLVININVTGTYTLGLGVSDATTADNPSALLIDNIQVISPVPEPTTIAFSVAGAALLVALRSRIRKSS